MDLKKFLPGKNYFCVSNPVERIYISGLTEKDKTPMASIIYNGKTQYVKIQTWVNREDMIVCGYLFSSIDIVSSQTETGDIKKKIRQEYLGDGFEINIHQYVDWLEEKLASTRMAL